MFAESYALFPPEPKDLRGATDEQDAAMTEAPTSTVERPTVAVS